jgi:SAM-dependent methyltransferase
MYNRLLTYKDVSLCKNILIRDQWIEKGFRHDEFWQKDAAMMKWITLLEEFKSIQKNNLKVIDLGSADGVVPHIIASLGNDVTGIDLMCVDHWCPKGLTKMILGDALYELKQMDDASVDVVIDSCSVHSFDPVWGFGVENWGWKNVADEVHRVLKPKGRFITSTDVTLSSDPGEFISPENIIKIVESSGLKLTSKYKKEYEYGSDTPYYQADVRNIQNVGLYIATFSFEKKSPKIISHRGNLSGANPDRENTVNYIEEAIAEGFDVEIDLRVKDGQFYLGHDGPRHHVTMEWLGKYIDVLWIHCKNREALEKLSSSVIKFNYFWHECDRYTLTSKGIGWVLVGQYPYSNSVIVLPESIDLYRYQPEYIESSYGICTDTPLFYKNEFGVKNEVGN